MSSKGKGKATLPPDIRPRNTLDSTAPRPRGKEREVPKEKKPKTLRRKLNAEKSALKAEKLSPSCDKSSSSSPSPSPQKLSSSPQTLSPSPKKSDPHLDKLPPGSELRLLRPELRMPRPELRLLRPDLSVPRQELKMTRPEMTLARIERTLNMSPEPNFSSPQRSILNVTFDAGAAVAYRDSDTLLIVNAIQITQDPELPGNIDEPEAGPSSAATPEPTDSKMPENYEEDLVERLSRIDLVSDLHGMVLFILHTPVHREYARQALTNEIEYTTYNILVNLGRFQDRTYQRSPEKMEIKRRFVCGFHQSTKFIRLKKVKLVIMAPDIEQVAVDGVLDEAIENFMSLCQEKEVQIIFTATRTRLARVCSKLPRSRVACIAIIDYSGAQDEFQKLIQFAKKAKETYENTRASLSSFLENLSENQLKDVVAFIKAKRRLPSELQFYRDSIYSPLKRNVHSYIRLIKRRKS